MDDLELLQRSVKQDLEVVDQGIWHVKDWAEYQMVSGKKQALEDVMGYIKDRIKKE